MKKMLSVTEWHQMVMDGSAPPMRIVLNGWSMYPLIRIRRDYVTIVQPGIRPAIGDIVLFSDPNKEGRYVVHRVWKRNEKKGSVLTWGDNCQRPDEWIPLECIWGKVILIERNNRKIRPHPKTGIIWAWLWHQIMKAYRMRERIRLLLGRKNKR